MNGRQRLIGHALAQRDAEVDQLIARIERLRELSGYKLLRGYVLSWDEEDPGFLVACLAGCMLIEGPTDPREVERVTYRPSEDQHEAVYVLISTRNRSRFNSIEGRRRLDEIERAWETAEAFLADREQQPSVARGMPGPQAVQLLKGGVK